MLKPPTDFCLSHVTATISVNKNSCIGWTFIWGWSQLHCSHHVWLLYSIRRPVLRQSVATRGQGCSVWAISVWLYSEWLHKAATVEVRQLAVAFSLLREYVQQEQQQQQQRWSLPTGCNTQVGWGHQGWGHSHEGLSKVWTTIRKM